jgi:hypothetical protein
MRGFNDEEVGALVKFTARNSDIIRGLIFQPVAFTGRATDNPFREKLRDWRFVEEVENQTEGQITTADFFPLPVMVSPIMIMRKFMKKPWPLFSCSPQCGVVNWMYVSKNSRIIPINHFVDFEKFFRSIQNGCLSRIQGKTISAFNAAFGSHAIAKLAPSHKRNRFLYVDEDNSQDAHIPNLSVTRDIEKTDLPARLHGIHGPVQLRREPRAKMRDTLRYTRFEDCSILRIQQRSPSRN